MLVFQFACTLNNHFGFPVGLVTWLCIFNGHTPGVAAAQETAKIFFQVLRDAIDTIESLQDLPSRTMEKGL